MSAFATELHHIPDEEDRRLAATVARFDNRMNYIGDIPEVPKLPKDFSFRRWPFNKPWTM